LVLHSRVLHRTIFTAANPRKSVNDQKQLEDAVSVATCTREETVFLSDMTQDISALSVSLIFVCLTLYLNNFTDPH